MHLNPSLGFRPTCDRMAKACARAVFLLSLLLCLAVPAGAKAGDYTYTVTDGSVTITRYTGPGGVVAIPDTIDGLPVKRIGGWAFQFSHNLEELTIPEGVTSIENWAFGGCDKLKSISIPSTVAGIGEMAFIQCASLTSIAVDELNSSFSSVDGALFDKSKELLIQCPGGKVGSYIVPDTVTRIGEKAFDHCSQLASITLGSNVTSIGKDAFYFCEGLFSVSVPGSVSSIADWTFQRCTNLAAVYFTGKAPRAGSHVFYQCDKVIVYHLDGATGWGTTFSQQPTSLWSSPSLRTFLRPDDAVLGGAKWQVDGGDWLESGATVTNLADGDHTISFSTVSGWLSPASQTVKVTGGECAIALGSYYPPQMAAASARLTNGFVVAVTVTDHGCGYVDTPAVYLIGGGGTGARATAVLSNGVVTRIDTTCAGFGYTNAPRVFITSPLAKLRLSMANESLLSFSGLEAGSTYQVQTLVSGQWLDVETAMEAVSGEYSIYVSGVAGTNSYRLVKLPLPAQATAHAQISYGFMVGAEVTSGGSGYESAPEVRVVEGGGSGAKCEATVENGVITAISVLDAGFGYTNAPLIEIDAPAPLALARMTIDANTLRLAAADLLPGISYQFQSSTNLVDWVDWGTGFTADAQTHSERLQINESECVFRLRVAQ